VHAFLRRTWPVVDPVRLVFRLLTERSFLAEAADGILTGEEQQLLVWTRRPRSRKAAPWSVTDAFLVDEAVDVVGGTPTFGHVVADEAQDLSAMQLRAIGRRCRFGSATLLGDLAQRTTPWSADRWEEALGHLGRRSTRVEHLPRAFRAPNEVLDFANRLLPEIAPEVRPARSVRSVSGSLRVRAVAQEAVAAAWLQALDEALAEDGSVGLVVADPAVGAAGDGLAGRGIEYREVDRFDTETRLALLGTGGPRSGPSVRGRSAALVLVGQQEVEDEGDHADDQGAEEGRPEPVDLEGEVELVPDPGGEQEHEGVHDEGEQAQGEDEQGDGDQPDDRADDGIDQTEDDRDGEQGEDPFPGGPGPDGDPLDQAGRHRQRHRPGHEPHEQPHWAPPSRPSDPRRKARPYQAPSPGAHRPGQGGWNAVTPAFQAASKSASGGNR
jgi:hypothetical protein